MMEMTFEINENEELVIDYSKSDYKGAYNLMKFVIDSYIEECRKSSIVISKKDSLRMEEILNKLSNLSHRDPCFENDIVFGWYTQCLTEIIKKHGDLINEKTKLENSLEV